VEPSPDRLNEALIEEMHIHLQRIQGMSTRLSETSLTRDQRDYLTIFQQSISQLTQCLTRLTERERGDANVSRVAQPVEFRTLMRDWIRMPAQQAHARGGEMLCDIRPEIPEWLLLDSVQLQQLLVPWIEEVIRLSPVGCWTLTVAAGLPESGESQLCFRLESPKLPAGVLQPPSLLVAMQEQLSSTELPNGLQQEIVLPMPPSHDNGVSSVDEWASLVGALVLIVEAQAAHRQILRDLLTGKRLQPTVVETTKAALSAVWRASLLRRPYQFLLIDTDDQPDDAWAFIDQLRRDSESGQIAIIALGQTDTGVNRANQAGIGWCAKPVFAVDLMAAFRPWLAKHPETMVENDPPAASPSRPNSPRWLLVIEDTINQALFRHWLEGEGYHVLAASNEVQAIEIIGRLPLDGVLVNIDIPTDRGLDLAKQLRRQLRDSSAQSNRRIPMLGLVKQSTPALVQQSALAGIDDTFVQPGTSQELMRRIAAQLRVTPVPEAPPAESRFAMISAETLLGTTGRNESLLIKIISVFRQRSPDLLQRLREAVYSQKSADIIQAAHAYRGMVAIFSLSMCDPILRIETLAQQEMHETLPTLLAEVDVRARQLDRALEQLTLDKLISLLPLI